MKASPLHWPVGWPRTKRPTRSRFGDYYKKPTIFNASNTILDEIRRLGGGTPIISTDLRLRQDGLPYSSQRQPEDQGAAVYFTYKGDQMVIACDNFDLIGCNLWAISKTIEAMRGIDRWGCSELLNRAFTGFKALPEQASPSNIRDWWDILQVSPEADPTIIKSAYRTLARVYHPDNQETGDTNKFKELKTAFDQASEITV